MHAVATIKKKYITDPCSKTPLLANNIRSLANNISSFAYGDR